MTDQTEKEVQSFQNQIAKFSDVWVKLIYLVSIAKMQGKKLEYHSGIDSLIDVLFINEKNLVEEFLKTNPQYDQVFQYIVFILEQNGFINIEKPVIPTRKEPPKTMNIGRGEE